VIDTHAHIGQQGAFGEDYVGGTAGVIERAIAAGVRHIICIGAGGDRQEAQSALDCARLHRGISAICGIHPHDAKNVDAELWAFIADVCAQPEVVAVGETGLDFHYNQSAKDVQFEVFRQHIRLARQLKKPLCIHTREAESDTLRILREENADEVGGVIHCFSGTAAFAQAAVEFGFYLSIPGIVTFKKPGELVEAVAAAPLDRLLVETDSPFLAPMPYRGRRNEPAYVAKTLEKVAEIKGLSVAQMDAITTANALRLFGVRLAVGLALR